MFDFGPVSDLSNRFDTKRLAQEIQSIEVRIQTELARQYEFREGSNKRYRHQLLILSLTNRALLLETRLQGELTRRQMDKDRK
jgi:hypothetical protein